MVCERGVVHAVCQAGVAREEVVVPPGMDRVWGADGEDVGEVIRDCVGLREGEELGIERGGCHCCVKMVILNRIHERVKSREEMLYAHYQPGTWNVLGQEVSMKSTLYPVTRSESLQCGSDSDAIER